LLVGVALLVSLGFLILVLIFTLGCLLDLSIVFLLLIIDLLTFLVVVIVLSPSLCFIFDLRVLDSGLSHYFILLLISIIGFSLSLGLGLRRSAL